jgi:hypothetical protein
MIKYKIFGQYRQSLDPDSKVVRPETKSACVSRCHISIAEHHKAYITKFSRAANEIIRHY